MERPNAIRLTDAAAEHVKAIIAQSEKPVAGVRLGLKNAGCVGMAYTLDFAEEPGPHDEVVEDKGVTIMIDPKAIMYLLGTEMDWQQDKLTSGFVFNNPNVVGACGCGESVSFAAQ